ncbi:hypothetical protein COCC4DRAFT_149555 [Bipolaris maydis ATCC 48331]|uniref:Homeobox domain-containing protein n=2 Tax=Cochliobolus heterostrophus TaxID=5016 RepID=M2TC82_COCH5|nr:uncharacterized protein COCC4DRAFT_149555 [Bipolaris maydis ATCC 48331]EMD95150.1 hypothetical protein COCHEDRAFT_1168783 [Bipolaris maydis C5]ENI00959.1 hypothetical protein COCC4DRAFT_149555 [Bipolaris maydis ATCC 48331]KAJ6214176.1 hypothetical protein PSV09DRAFT_1168783 [Bipolaris maydis]
MLDDGSFADLSEALKAVNAAPSYFNDQYLAEQTFRVSPNNSTASSSPFTPGTSVLRPKLGSRFSREVIRTLKDWLAVHHQHPYPNENEMLDLQNRTGLNKAQMTNWFANARRRGKVQSVRPGSPQAREKPTSPIDIIHRPGTPAIRSSHGYKDPMQRWVESPPEHEPAAASDIARAMASTSQTIEEPCCVFCGAITPNDAHVEAHHYSACQERNIRERTFHRKDHLVQHLRLVHGVEFADWSMASWMLPIPDVRSRCGFCGITMKTWLERTDHLADHFKSGTTMASWQGDWGFDSFIEPLLETAMPPADLIEWERGTLIPMKGSDPSWGTPPNAYELLKVETEFFIQRYFDENGHLPDNDAIQLEACRIIFAAETTSGTSSQGTEKQHRVSWLRDLVMSSPALTERARFQPVRSARESRHFPLRINAKGHLFEHCPMEVRLISFVMDQTVAGLVPNDAQLQNEACQIVRQMEQETTTPSDIFANWVVKGIYSAANWLANFKQRAAILDVSSTNGALSSHVTDSWCAPLWAQPLHTNALESALDTTNPSQETYDFFKPLPAFSEGPPAIPSPTTQSDSYGRVRTLLPDDANFYRIFDSDMRRWAASTLSPKNPNCHVPSDEEIQHQARWIMYDSDDQWNQTPADFPVWLSRFKKEVGITTDAEAVDPKELAALGK